MARKPTVENQLVADTVEWLCKQFATKTPEKIAVRLLLERPDKDHLLGPMVHMFVFGPTDKSSKDAISAMAREVVAICQHDCDQIERRSLYGVFVSHFDHENGYYARWLMRLNPTSISEAV